jgi:hypothetical protein
MSYSTAFRFFVLPGSIAAVVLLAASSPAAAQVGGRVGGRVSGATGPNLALHGMTNPLGGFAPIATPGLPPVARPPVARPPVGNYPGYVPGAPLYNARRYGRSIGYPYAYSVWVPDYFDYVDQNQYYNPYAYGYGYQAAPPAVIQNAAPAPSQPVIINQYFNTPGPGQTAVQSQSPAPAPGLPPDPNDRTSLNPGDPLNPPQNYYLIAYKDHAVYPALAYWVEDRTLHYVTAQNTHNQASLDLIDLALTKSLNRDQNVPFSIPGQ